MDKLLYSGIAVLCLLASCEKPGEKPWGQTEGNAYKVLECSLYSSSLDQSVPYAVWLPREYDENKTYPFLYLLHGIEYGDQDYLHRSWVSKGNAAIIADEYQQAGGVSMVIIMPDGYNLFYVGDYESFLEEELMPRVEADYRGNGKRAVAGLSMGGFGTLYHALKYPKRFTYAYAMSPVTEIVGDELMKYVSDQPDKSVFPPFTIEVGTQDAVLDNEDARELYKMLNENGLRCEWVERSGGHTWEFWKGCLPNALKKAGDSFN